MPKLKKTYRTIIKVGDDVPGYNFTSNKSLSAFGVKIFLWSDSDIALNYEKGIRLGIKKLNSFFPIAPKSISFFLLSNRKKFLKLLGEKNAPNWLVAFAQKGDTQKIFIDVSDEKLSSIKTATKILRHEIAHIYTNLLNPLLPDWVKEGVSVYLAHQIHSTHITTEDWRTIKPNKHHAFFMKKWKTLANKHHAYNNSGLCMLFLLKYFGQKKILRKISTYEPPQDFIQFLSKSFGIKKITLLLSMEKTLVKK